MFALSVADPTSDDFLGSCQLWPHEPHDTLELVYAILLENPHAGFATEVAKAVTGYALSNPELNEVVAFVVPDNVASVRVVEQLSFRNAGHVLDHGRSPIRFCARRKTGYTEATAEPSPTHR
jgi:ribosomal-protein-alanine N-acetyltransferase